MPSDAPFPIETVVGLGRSAWADGRFRGRLPHLEVEGGTYFLTFCLADVAPSRSARRRAIEEDRPELWDPGGFAGECLLADDDAAAMVDGALVHFNGERYLLHAWCVMPNHVHVVVSPSVSHSLAKITHSWKSFTAHAINRRLGRSGRVWQNESFDHLIRTIEGVRRYVEYTEANPVKADLSARAEDWRFSSARRR